MPSTDEARTQLLLAARERGLRMIGERAPLRVVLTHLAATVEALAQGQVVASILLLEERGMATKQQIEYLVDVPELGLHRMVQVETTTQSLESSLDAPDRSVIVLTGDLNRFRKDLFREVLFPSLLRFVERGGNVLIASDQPHLLTGVGEIQAGPVFANRS